MMLRVSLPATLEGFVRARLAGSERVEVCHDGRRWSCTAVDADRRGCKPATATA